MSSQSQKRETELSTRSSRIRFSIGVLAAVLVVTVLAGGVLWWRQEESFCTKVAGLPDVMGSVAKSGSPANGFIDYANKLDDVASAAPDPATAEAARTLASTQRAIGEAIGNAATSETVASAVMAAATADATAAQVELSATIATKCP